jgi:NhaP-type Na+/H+ or K+/H+ antiporter
MISVAGALPGRIAAHLDSIILRPIFMELLVQLKPRFSEASEQQDEPHYHGYFTMWLSSRGCVTQAAALLVPPRYNCA